MSDNQPSASRDFDKPSKEIAMQQIFAATGYSAPPSKVTFGDASVLDQFPEVASDENSFVPFDVAESEDSRFVGDNGFIYRRLDLSEIPANADIPSVPITYPFKVHDALPLINSFLGTQLDESDVENDTFTAPPVILRAKPGSVAWMGQRSMTPSNDDDNYLVTDPVIASFVEWKAPAEPADYYAGTSKTRLVTLINEHANLELEEGTDFTFGKLTTTAGRGYNTRIRITPAPESAYVEQDLYYNRLSLDVLRRLPPGQIEAVPIRMVPFTIHGILNEINDALGLNLTTAEVFNTSYTTRQDTYVLQVRSGASLAWLPSSFSFTADHNAAISVRHMEDGSVRLQEDGSPRDMETLEDVGQM